jgi:RNA-dependent RNA polymerase
LAGLARPIITLLEARGVQKEAFISLQEAAKADIFLSGDSLDKFRRLINDHKFGGTFHLAFILEELYALGLDFKSDSGKTAIESAFLGRLLRYAMNHSLRDVKFKARIPVPNSYQLVGVADEGQAYIAEGTNPEDVFTLQQGQIYGTYISMPHIVSFMKFPIACVQEFADRDPVYLKGTCVISRSPVIYPGDGMFSAFIAFDTESIQKYYSTACLRNRKAS